MLEIVGRKFKEIVVALVENFQALVLMHRFFSVSLVVFFILWHTSAGYAPSQLKVERKGKADQASGAYPIGWEKLDWFYVSVRIGLFLWIALLNLITISSTWASVIDVMDSEVLDYLDLLVPEPHLDSFVGRCLPQEGYSWVHFYC